MKLLLSYFKAIASFGYVGAVVGSLSSYIVSYWGTHRGMIEGLTHPAPGIHEPARRVLLSNLQFGLVFAMLPAIAAGAFFALLYHQRRVQMPLFALLVVAVPVGALAAWAFFPDPEHIGMPIVSGAISAPIALLGLHKSLRRWFCQPSASKT